MQFNINFVCALGSMWKWMDSHLALLSKAIQFNERKYWKENLLFPQKKCTAIISLCFARTPIDSPAHLIRAISHYNNSAQYKTQWNLNALDAHRAFEWLFYMEYVHTMRWASNRFKAAEQQARLRLLIVPYNFLSFPPYRVSVTKLHKNLRSRKRSKREEKLNSNENM